ncbi:MAG: hypothetical protein QF535_01255, partial [Anaerolineales bacterium]|nr:hypothetical protein [Anaerolineales bacterium]
WVVGHNNNFHCVCQTGEDESDNSHWFVACEEVESFPVDVDGVLHVPDEYATISLALITAVDDDVIQISAGTYNTHNLNTQGKRITIQGEKNGDGSPATTIDGTGLTGSVLVCNSLETSDTIIENLTITGGTGENLFGGGGVRMEMSSPTIRNCHFIANTCSYGGGMMLWESDAVIEDCVFNGNWTSTYGGGMYISYSDPIITNCTFVGNSSISADYTDNLGGAIYNEASSPTLTSCTIDNNSSGYGGGIYNKNGSSPTLISCVVSANIGKVCGGGMYTEDGAARVALTSFCANQPDHIVGGWVNQGGNSFSNECEDAPGFCYADVNSDYDVDVLDMLYVIAVYGSDNPAGDINEDGIVNVQDMLAVISNWGGCD